MVVDSPAEGAAEAEGEAGRIGGLEKTGLSPVFLFIFWFFGILRLILFRYLRRREKYFYGVDGGRTR